MKTFLHLRGKIVGEKLKIHDLSLPSQIKFIHCIHQPSHRWSENWLCVGMWIQAWILIWDRCKRILICICFAWTDITIFSLKKLNLKRKYRSPFTKHKIARQNVFVRSWNPLLIRNGNINVESVGDVYSMATGASKWFCFFGLQLNVF